MRNRQNVISAFEVLTVGSFAGYSGETADENSPGGIPSSTAQSTDVETPAGTDTSTETESEGTTDAVTQQWAFDTNSRVFFSPEVVDGTVYNGSHDNSVYAINTDPEIGNHMYRLGDSTSGNNSRQERRNLRRKVLDYPAVGTVFNSHTVRVATEGNND